MNSSRLRLPILALCLILAACSKTDTPSTPPPEAPSGTPATQSTPCQTLSFPSGDTLEYCTQRSTQNPLPTHIIYFFHGLGGSPSDIFREPFATALRLALEQMRQRMPHVVSLSFGPSDAIPIDPNLSPNTRAGELLAQALPKIEQDLGYTMSNPPVRDLLGASMGGFNVLTLAASQPRRFQAVMALCPALIDFDPFTPSEVESYMARHQPYIRRDRVATAMAQLKANFPNRESWQSSDPLRQIAKGIYDGLPLFISIGRQDEFGFIEGARAFVNTGEARGLNITWRPVNGPHCFFDLNTLREFLRGQLETPP